VRHPVVRRVHGERASLVRRLRRRPVADRPASIFTSPGSGPTTNRTRFVRGLSWTTSGSRTSVPTSVTVRSLYPSRETRTVWGLAAPEVEPHRGPGRGPGARHRP
jgi:hypothetical protein